ncbi:phage GP46 family protein [Silvanigrella sp.]|jgi:phage gp46-like protein|uniref:phage GP46 family protein n=1 Tax=Silvanigrella sp. TaxID=2024976 RepID=UPI0037C681F9
MKDIIFKYDHVQKCFDLDLNNIIGDSLESKIGMLLFTDTRCENYELPEYEQSKKGFWADAFDKTNLGSKLWLLKRAKKTNNILNDINAYCIQALQPLVNEKIVSKIEIDSHFEKKAIVISITVYSNQGNIDLINYNLGDNNGLQNSNIQRIS